MKKNIIPIFIFFILTILAVNIAFAEIEVDTYTYDNDFVILSGSDTINTCSCTMNADSITVQNTGNYPAVFSLSLDTDLSGRLRLSDKSFALDPGQSKQVSISYDAECSKVNRQYVLTVYSNLGTQKSIVKNLIIDKCQNIEMWILGNNQTVKPSQDATFPLYVKNSGPFAEDYE